MSTEITSRILNDLTNLLIEDLSPRSISYQFEKIAALLSKGNLQIEKTDCKEYYEDSDLSLIHLMKNEAIANAHFEQATKFRMIENELLAEKGDNEFTRLKKEPFSFELKSNNVIFHFNREKENQRLVANLIEGYNLIHKNAHTYNSLYC